MIVPLKASIWKKLIMPNVQLLIVDSCRSLTFVNTALIKHYEIAMKVYPFRSSFVYSYIWTKYYKILNVLLALRYAVYLVFELLISFKAPFVLISSFSFNIYFFKVCFNNINELSMWKKLFCKLLWLLSSDM